jgi:hypothetical protein
LSTLFVRFRTPHRDLLENPTLGGTALQRSPLLERLLARADRAELDDWRRAAYRALARGPEDPPAVGAAALLAARDVASAGPGIGPGAGSGQSAFMATPVHCVATMSTVHLAADGVLRLEAAEAAELAADFNRRFLDGGQRLVAASDGSLCCVFDHPVNATSADPVDVAGNDIHGFLPSGPDGPMLRRAMSEIEMWLFEHRLNQRRAAAGAPLVTGLWLWGGGPTIAQLPALRGSIVGYDPLFGSWPELAQPLRSDGERPAAPTVVIVADLPGSAAWREAESTWIVPALAALRSGRIATLDLSAGSRRYRLTARWRWRLWRRTRPWWEFFT